MNPKLAALLVVFGIAGGAILLKTTTPGTTDAQLIDAGIQQEHVLIDGRCEMLLLDGGYESRSGSVWANRDGGSVVFDNEDLDDVAAVLRCRRGGAGGSNKTRLAKVTGECACKGASGICRNASNADLGFGRIAGPDYPPPFNSFSGAGCVRMQCQEFSGIPIWPADCPREDAGVRLR